MSKPNKKLLKQAAKIAKQSIPQLDLKREDFIHTVAEDSKIELIIHWRNTKGQQFEPETLGPVHAFAIQEGKLKVINRALMDTAYTFNLKEIKRVFIMPIEV
jgi:hypothetical protein